eukprot:222323-Prymnesium_polylepis.1
MPPGTCTNGENRRAECGCTLAGRKLCRVSGDPRRETEREGTQRAGGLAGVSKRAGNFATNA